MNWLPHAAWCLLFCMPGFAAENTLRFNFEEKTLQGWQVVEGQFDRLLSDCAFFHNQPDIPYNKEGTTYLNTLEKRDGSRTDQFTGVLESPVFLLSGSRISFLIGGGSHPAIYVALCREDGEELLHAQGRDTETMQRITWDASPYVGQRLFVRLVDRHSGGWGHVTFDDFTAEGTIDIAATDARFARLEAARLKQEHETRHQAIRQLLATLRPAVEALTNADKSRYTIGPAILARLDQIQLSLASAPLEESQSLLNEVQTLQRQALLANPLLTEHPILFIVRPQYQPDHHSTATMFQNGEINTRSFRGGSALKCWDGKTGTVTTLLDCPEGIIRDPDIHFDGNRVLFSMRHSIADDYHVYEYHLETRQLKQLTFGGELSDIDPIYMPDGRITFVSTREPKLCQCNRHVMGNLFVMEGDGSFIRQIGYNTLFEGHPCLLEDGRILYDRWEYVDKHFGPAFGLWTVNPDGTNHAVYYGNNAWAPGAIVDARPVPQTQTVVATLGSCHDRPWGAIAVIDREQGMDGTEPIIHCWPADSRQRITHLTDYKTGWERNHPAGGQIDNFVSMPIKYEDPFPLSSQFYLCARTLEGERTGLFLLDTFGNEILIHAEGAGCFDPMPVTARPRPPVIPSRVDYNQSTGTYYIMDVYKGTGMERVPRGTIQTLRVVEAPPKLFWTDTNWNLDATQAPAMNFNCTNNKRVLGTVPVEADGSAYFQVPSGRFVFFQLLDENGMMVQSMRSGTSVQPGEKTGCVGCHDSRLTSIANKLAPLAMNRPPSAIQPWHGETEEFNYLTDVQPVFDRYCVSCHDFGQPAGETLNLSGDLGLVFNTSYLELNRRSGLRWVPPKAGEPLPLIKPVHDGPAEALPPYSWGSHQSRLAQVIRGPHHGVEIDPESRDRVITWIDLNAPYYGSYASVYPTHVFGRSPLNDQQIQELRQLTGVLVGDISTELQGSQVNFTRPENSPCLGAIKTSQPEKFKRALEIIRQGQAQLAQRPRMDMPGARLLPADQKKVEKYLRHRDNQTSVRQALAGR